MSPSGITDEVLLFISNHIRSVEQLELLNLMQDTAPRAWNAAEIAKQLYISPEAAQSRLEEFHAKQMLRKDAVSDAAYYFAPATSDTARLISQVLREYKEKRVAIINAIYSNPNENIKIFADAFKFKK